jgi:hypothetical protein
MPTLTTRPIVDDPPLVATLHVAFDLGNTSGPWLAHLRSPRRRGCGPCGRCPLGGDSRRPAGTLGCRPPCRSGRATKRGGMASGCIAPSRVPAFPMCSWTRRVLKCRDGRGRRRRIGATPPRCSGCCGALRRARRGCGASYNCPPWTKRIGAMRIESSPGSPENTRAASLGAEACWRGTGAPHDVAESPGPTAGPPLGRHAVAGAAPGWS